jgi:hypothetical protein
MIALRNHDLPEAQRAEMARLSRSGCNLLQIGGGSDGKPPRVNAMSKHAQDRHKRAARMLGFALTLGDAPTWVQVGAVWQLRLTEVELASVAFAALQGLEPDTRLAVFGAAHWEGAQ